MKKAKLMVAGTLAFAGLACGSTDDTCISEAGEGCDAPESDPAAAAVPLPLPERISRLDTDLALGARGESVRAVQDYLSAFGYFPNPDLSREYPSWRPVVLTQPTLSVYDTATVEAVEQLQLRAGLDVTGRVDQATRVLMQTPRCGVPDQGDSPDVEKFSLAARWTRGVTVSWKMGSGAAAGTTVPFSATALHDAAAAAFNAWEAQSSIHFAEDTNPAHSANITIQWAPPASFNPGTALGSSPNPPSNLTVLVNNSYKWSSDTTFAGTVANPEFDLQGLLLHELGHAIGLNHSSIGNANVDPAYNAGIDAIMNSGQPPERIVRQLTQDDRVGISAQYDTWEQLNGGALEIDVGGNGVAWVLGDQPTAAGSLIWQRSGSTWIQTKNAAGSAFDNFRAVRIAVDVSGVPWVIEGGTNKLYKRNTSTANNGSWSEVVVGTCAKDVDVGADGSVWIVNCTNRIQRLNQSTSTWAAAIGASVARIAVDNAGVPWVNYSNRTLAILNPSTGVASPLSGRARDIAAGPSVADDSGLPVRSVYLIGDDDITAFGSSLWLLMEQSAGDGGPAALQLSEWVQLDGAAVHIAVGPDAMPWVVDGANHIHHRLK